MYCLWVSGTLGILDWDRGGRDKEEREEREERGKGGEKGGKREEEKRRARKSVRRCHRVREAWLPTPHPHTSPDRNTERPDCTHLSCSVVGQYCTAVSGNFNPHQQR